MNSRFSHFSYSALLGFCFVFSVCLLLASFSLLPTPYSHAQSIPGTTGGIVIEASSVSPYPGQEVTITAQSYTLNINSAAISWIVDGKELQSGVGITSLRVKAPVLGKKITISITAQSPEGIRASGSYIVSSGSVDMIVESSGYTHPLFKGKLAPVFQNTLTITAIPHIGAASGAEYDPQTLVYTWRKNDKVIQDQSGYGRQSLTLIGDALPRPYEVNVTVTPRIGGTEVQGTAYITARTPSITFYTEDQLYGTFWNRAIVSTTRIGSEKETSVRAVPYGFNKPLDSVGSLAFTWLINNLKRVELASQESVVLRAPDGAAGSSNIRLDIRNTEEIMQGASASFSAYFSGDAENQEGISTDTIQF